MAVGNSVWGIDIGQCGLKAIKLRAAGDQVELAAFDVIEHPKLLSQPDADADELIRAALDKFLSRNDWQGDRFVVGVPGQQTFARFCKLPPVDPKKIPDIVQFEASQQIPFDMDEVVWDYQVFSAEDSPDVEVGIFAIKKDLIRKHIEYFTASNIAPMAVQTAPSALYNFSRFDRKSDSEGTATVIIDIGAQNTDLVIAEASRAWSRNIPLGGNNFTEALVKAFKLSFAKAESLKKQAATSKYARQIFQAMRPVFADLVAEVQRSIGFYTSTHRDVTLRGVLGLGNAFRLPGLQKYLENNLTIPGGVTKLEKFNALVPSATVNAPQFTDNVLSFGVAYGLALQGLGLASISASLLPQELARVALWNKKRPYFGLAAACLGLATTFVWSRHMMDSSALAGTSDARQQTQSILSQAQRLKQEYGRVSTDTSGKEVQIKRYLSLTEGRDLVPRLLALVHEAMPDVGPELAAVKSPDELKKLIESNPARFERSSRKNLIIETFETTYAQNIETIVASEDVSSSGSGHGRSSYEGDPMGPSGGGGHMDYQVWEDTETSIDDEDGDADLDNAGFLVKITGRMSFGKQRAQAHGFLNSEFLPALKRLGTRPGLGFYVMDEDPARAGDKKNPYVSVNVYYQRERNIIEMFATNRANPSNQAGMNNVIKDPVTDEPMDGDWKFEVTLKVKIGEKPPPEQAAENDESDGG